MVVDAGAHDLSGFRQSLRDRFDERDTLRMDLHCHDRNSDVTDELWGRILRLPESWLEPQRLIEVLRANGSTALTITNHNNARSCWALQEQGHDVLSAAEFTCYLDEHDLFLHVLAYGFDRRQERVLNEKRGELYGFLRYANEIGVPVVLPHPLYFYTRNENIDLALFEKLAVVFQRFEVLNGQRDLWQSLLTLTWLQGLTPERVEEYAERHHLNPAEFGVDLSRAKVLTGGSDCHNGLFAGTCGSRLHVPHLRERLGSRRASELALEALREGRVSPYGYVGESEKLSIALLDYFSQVAVRIEDPGLLRILLHRGETRDKLACLAIGNLLLEVRKHKTSRKFFELVHDALQGRRPSRLLRWRISKDYRFALDHLDRIAVSSRKSSREYVATVTRVISDMFRELSELVVRRVESAGTESPIHRLETLSSEELIRKFEIPSQVTALFFDEPDGRSDMSSVDLKEFLDRLSFPSFMGLFLTGATVASTRALHANRPFLDKFAQHVGATPHAKRALYLTDTLRDRNGVSNSLSGKLAEIQRRDLPIDFLICQAGVAPEPNLHVVAPLTTFTAGRFADQEFRVPNPLQIAEIFYRGGYDRIVCSTEGPMLLVALFLKFMFNVPAYFFMHTDWLDFAAHMTDLNAHERDRIRRLLRAIYRQFDGIFVLNSDHRAWLVGHDMQIPAERVHLTAHHAQPRHPTAQPIDKRELFDDANENTPVLFLACRLSREKGIFELPAILERARRAVPELKLVIAGSGPAEGELRAALPDARFLGWVDRERLAQCYLGLDLFVFPSRFDTFGNVLVEAMMHGMPAVAFDCKGPKDIIEHERSGYLARSVDEMGDRIAAHFRDRRCTDEMRRAAMLRAETFQAEPILDRFLRDLGLDGAPIEDTNDIGRAGTFDASGRRERSVA